MYVPLPLAKPLKQIWDSINSIRSDQLEARDANVRLAHSLQQLLSQVQNKLETLNTTLQDFSDEMKEVRTQSSGDANTIKDDIGEKLEALGEMIQYIHEALDEKGNMDIRQQNRRIRQHIPFAFQPRSSKDHSNI